MLVLLVVCLAVGVLADSPRVETAFGPVEGFEYKLKDGRNVNVFLGIPPACHAHHFGTAQQLEPPGTHFHEDCLFMNVIAPAEKSSDPNGYPVLVFIYGGGFEVGSANSYGFKNISENFVSQGVVFVTFNYRLALLGFFSTGDNVAPGNIGLWDQTLALQFIKDTISRFGGDSNRVTLSGESAGAASVSALSYSPHSNHLFKQVIIMSGSLHSPWVTHPGVVSESLKVAEILGCKEGSAEIKRCLKTKTIEQIYSAIYENGPAREGIFGIKFNPRMDGDFLPGDLPTMLRNSPMIPTITGITDAEGASLVIDESFKTMALAAVPRANWSTFLAEDMKKYIRKNVVGENHGEAGEFLVKLLEEFYVERPKENGIEMTARDYLNRLSQLIGDLWSNTAPYQEAQAKAIHGSPVYLYIENYHNPTIAETLQLPVRGAFHGNEILYLFGSSYEAALGFNENDWEFQKDLLEGFISFTKTGKPTVRGKPWEAITENQPDRFMSFTPNSEMKTGYMKESNEFWLNEICKKVDAEVIKKRLLPCPNRIMIHHTEL
ncbi:hypothetical protein L596_015750 [Steinernema carpocapsae]|uniref:Carboxylic ester hydrolase n=1 Tax=Steinernema carpocapsae TaxID=34508 RepID=A0A4U5NGW5_STECR|nr:hypothetical protein L596_015750 [Steinernema carpocapsae]